MSCVILDTEYQTISGGWKSVPSCVSWLNTRHPTRKKVNSVWTAVSVVLKSENVPFTPPACNVYDQYVQYKPAVLVFNLIMSQKQANFYIRQVFYVWPKYLILVLWCYSTFLYLLFNYYYLHLSQSFEKKNLLGFYLKYLNLNQKSNATSGPNHQARAVIFF